MSIEEILQLPTAEDTIKALKQKRVSVPAWSGKDGLQTEYDPKQHPVMNKTKYPDIVTDNSIQPVTRITCDLQRLAVKRMSELICGIPVKRVYKPTNDKQKEIAAYLEAIYNRNRIDSVNVERLNMLFASCEVMTLWYAIEQPNTQYGFNSKLKIRCRNLSPMQGNELYPLFDEYGDLIALSVGYTNTEDSKHVQYFDTYTKKQHIKWQQQQGEWKELQNETISLLKIPAVYASRPTPIWEDTSKTVYEIEWALSRNGNYLRENSKPLFVVFADEQIHYGDEGDPNKEFKSVMQYPQGSNAQYITWQQAVDNLKFYVEQLRSIFFTQLQLPDWSYDKMSQQALSGESRKQMFIDSQLKVKDESGRLLEFFDREINVVKAFLIAALGEGYKKDIEALQVDTQIIPFTISDDKDTINNLITANGGQPILSQREAIALYGKSDDVDKTLKEIAEQQDMNDLFKQEPAQ
ncbi:hypothetical protein HMPREF1860_01323 [Prevotella amnii]|uniref:Phage portal protein, SPP1 Gp6 n=1 Tax=Prevotella amnii TaxID=419005 RepID=A0A134BCB0_9BACT|nr:phage portal protein [Prevotella amnii]KXB77569.1 hypothetical protein HMPREF1860_01323 [Prevotella amnii]